MSMREYYENLDQYAIYDYKDVKNAYGHGEADAVDKVLEIIDKAQYKTITFADGSYVLHTDRSVLRDAVFALKEGEQE